MSSTVVAATQPAPPMVSGGLPLLGHVLDFLRDREALMQRGFAEHGLVFAMNLVGQRVAVVAGAEHNKLYYGLTDTALSTQEPYASVRAAFGDVIFLAGPDAYKNQRPFLRAMFSREKMPGYLDAMNVEVQAWVDGLEDGATIDIVVEACRLAQDVAGRAFVGPEFRSELPAPFWAAYDAIARSIDLVLPPNLPLPKFIRRDRAKVEIRKYIAAAIERRRAEPDRYDDCITLAMTTPLEDGEPMSEELIAKVFVALLFAGHETTAGQAAWAIISAVKDPELMKSLVAEVDQVMDQDASLGAKALRSLENIFLVVDETTRLYPSADMQARRAMEPVTFGSYTVPEGWHVFTSAAVSHHLPSMFEGSDQFDPSRLTRGEGKSPWDNVGFGGGTHKCTGMNFARNEIAIILARLLREFELELLTKDTRVQRGVGANRPSPTRVRLRRRLR